MRGAECVLTNVKQHTGRSRLNQCVEVDQQLVDRLLLSPADFSQLQRLPLQRQGMTLPDSAAIVSPFLPQWPDVIQRLRKLEWVPSGEESFPVAAAAAAAVDDDQGVKVRVKVPGDRPAAH